MEACKLTVENARLNGVSERLEVLTETWAESNNFFVHAVFNCFTVRMGQLELLYS